MTTPAGLPNVPVGTPLCLAPGEWSYCSSRPPEALTVIRVAKVHTDRAHTNADEVWVTGHRLECSYTTSDCSVPCVELLVRVDAIRRNMAGR